MSWRRRRRGACWSSTEGRRRRKSFLVPLHIPLVAALVVDSGSGMFALAGFAGDVTVRAVFPWAVARPEMLVRSSSTLEWHVQGSFSSSRCVPCRQAHMFVILVAMDKKDTYAAGWFYW